MRKRYGLFVGIMILTALFISACGPMETGRPDQTSKSGASQVADFAKVPLNSRGLTAEQQNIVDRIRVTTDPTKVMWIHLIALDGKIMKRMSVRNKITSSEKRLEPVMASSKPEYGYALPSYGEWHTEELIQPDGTFGKSDNYVYWFDPMGRYHQWGTAGGLGYLLTDYPIDLNNSVDEITGLYKMQEAAYKWQLQQEDKLKKTEAVAKSQHDKTIGEMERKAREMNQQQNSK
jgi:hypothetical protein